MFTYFGYVNIQCSRFNKLKKLSVTTGRAMLNAASYVTKAIQLSMQAAFCRGGK